MRHSFTIGTLLMQVLVFDNETKKKKINTNTGT